MPAFFGPDYSPKMVAAIASCTAAICRLDARFTVSSVASAWTRRAAWSGYAQALCLQSAEIDEIDVFSWGCGLQIPGRPLRSTTIDLFDRFAEWTTALGNHDPLAWRDSLPMAVSTPRVTLEHPALIRAIDQVCQHARIDATALPWLGLAFALRDMGVTATPVPCLAGGAKALRMKRRPDEGDWLAVLHALEAAARIGLERLQELERHHRKAQRAIVAQFRPGALPRLLALSTHQPLLSPQSVADRLGLTVAGASKLLDRAVASQLLVEITQRRSWRLFLAPDLARVFGYVKVPRGRPRTEAPPLPPSRDLAATFDAFDAEMEAIDRLLSSLPVGVT
ncbi:hypothetical protein [Sphingobium aromaticiconvertens]|uniref:hypothetical protein n=1 Tax=Sphingobium aromaticiconvertens TaxID=365341 RepID=UPI00301A0728